MQPTRCRSFCGLRPSSFHEKLAERKYGVLDEKTFNALRNYVLCNLTAMRLYGILSAEGEEAFAAEVARVVKA